MCFYGMSDFGITAWAQAPYSHDFAVGSNRCGKATALALAALSLAGKAPPPPLSIAWWCERTSPPLLRLLLAPLLLPRLEAEGNVAAVYLFISVGAPNSMCMHAHTPTCACTHTPPSSTIHATPPPTHTHTHHLHDNNTGPARLCLWMLWMQQQIGQRGLRSCGLTHWTLATLHGRGGHHHHPCSP